MLVNAKEMLDKAYENGYGIGQFNINNLEWTKAILEACQEKKSAVILGVSEGAAKYMGGFNVVSKMVEGLDKDLNITVSYGKNDATLKDEEVEKIEKEFLEDLSKENINLRS